MSWVHHSFVCETRLTVKRDVFYSEGRGPEVGEYIRGMATEEVPLKTTGRLSEDVTKF